MNENEKLIKRIEDLEEEIKGFRDLLKFISIGLGWVIKK